MVDVATERSIDTIDQDPGVFQSDLFSHPHFKEFTDNAKDLTKQILRSYNKGDPDTVDAVRKYEGKIEPNAEYHSGKALQHSTAWDIFYQAHQKYIGTALTNEDKDLPEAQRKSLEGQHGFDMRGRHMFDFERLMKSGKIAPKGID